MGIAKAHAAAKTLLIIVCFTLRVEPLGCTIDAVDVLLATWVAVIVD